MLNLGCVHTKCDTATKTQYFPFIHSYRRTLYTIVALVVHTSSNNFHHKPVLFWSLQCASHSSCQSQVSQGCHTTTQLNYTTQSHTVNHAMLITWDSLPHNHHTTLPGFNAAPDMICECSLIPSLPFIPSFLYISRCVFLRWGWHGIGLQVTRAPVSLWHWHDDHGEGKLWIYFRIYFSLTHSQFKADN